MRILIVTSVDKEAAAIRNAIGDRDDVSVIISGIARTNAAMASTRALIEEGPFDAVVNAGIAGALSAGSSHTLAIGDVVVATKSVYYEEGLVTAEGFVDCAVMGFPLGSFDGNAIDADAALLARAQDRLADGVFAPIATVATCSGTNAAAASVASRTKAAAEAMEGAAVMHVARAFGLPGIEIRSISNTTGDRAQQVWDIGRAMSALGDAIARFIA